MIKTHSLWAPLVTSGRKPWIAWTCVRSTRRDAKEAYLDGIAVIHHKEHLARVKFVKVYVATIDAKGGAA